MSLQLCVNATKAGGPWWDLIFSMSFWSHCSHMSQICHKSSLCLNSVTLTLNNYRPAALNPHCHQVSWQTGLKTDKSYPSLWFWPVCFQSWQVNRGWHFYSPQHDPATRQAQRGHMWKFCLLIKALHSVQLIPAGWSPNSLTWLGVSSSLCIWRCSKTFYLICCRQSDLVPSFPVCLWKAVWRLCGQILFKHNNYIFWWW